MHVAIRRKEKTITDKNQSFVLQNFFEMWCFWLREHREMKANTLLAMQFNERMLLEYRFHTWRSVTDISMDLQRKMAY